MNNRVPLESGTAWRPNLPEAKAFLSFGVVGVTESNLLGLATRIPTTPVACLRSGSVGPKWTFQGVSLIEVKKGPLWWGG